MIRSLGRFIAIIVLINMVGCRGPADTVLDPALPTLPEIGPGPRSIDPLSLANPRYDSVLAAGDTVLKTSDNAIQEMRARLLALGYGADRLHLLSADRSRFTGDFFVSAVPVDTPDARRREARSRDEDRVRKLPGGIDPATEAQLLRRVLSLDPGQSGACFVYLASSATGDGLAMGTGAIKVDSLNRALFGGCANAPTVIVISACQSGGFQSLAAPNRLVMVAAGDAERGFGCGPNVGFTTFDECFLGAFDAGGPWKTLFAATQSCVARRQALVGQSGVSPKIAIGALVADLPSPVPASDKAPAVAFRRGVGRFTADAMPFFPTLRQRNQATVDAYLKAPAPKAMALTYAGTVTIAADDSGRETLDDVSRTALIQCERESGGACVLFARNDSIAAPGDSGLAPLHKPFLNLR